jgi:hypothetical protein
VLAAQAQPFGTGTFAASGLDPVDLNVLASSDDVCRPGLDQSEVERVDRLFSTEPADEEVARQKALQPEASRAGSFETAQTMPAGEARQL